MSAERAITILHLSDPQFGPKHRFDGTTPGSLFARLRDDFEAMRARHGLVPDLVLITGDLVEYGKPSEFRQFREFAEAIAAHFGLPRRKVVLLPGNHDINRAAAEAYFKQCEADEIVPKPPYWPKLRHFAAMFAEFYHGEPDLTFTEGAPYTLFEYPDLQLVVAGLDSTIADSHRPEDHHGFLGEPQLRHFAGKLRAFAEQGLLRIAAVHHNPFPTGSSDNDLKDLADLKRILGPHLNLVVHGHVHEDEVTWLDNTVPVLGIGSAGVDLKQRPPEVPNQYQWIRIFADRLEFGSRAYVPDQKRWIDDLRADRHGSQWWQSKRVAFERVSATFAATPTSAQSNPEAALARAVAGYRATLARQLRHRLILCDLATYGEDGDLAGGLDLLTIFIPPQAAQQLPGADRQLTRTPIDPTNLEPEAEPLTERAPPQAIDRLLASPEHPWILVLGAPGAGKTTLTHWTALKLTADGETLGDLSPDLVPVKIDLRLFAEQQSAARRGGRSYDFFDYLDDRHREQSLPLGREALHALADAGRLVWLFDGLDEIADATHRREVADMLLGLRAHVGGRGVVTGRIVGCSELQPRFHHGDIHCFTLLDFEDPQIEAFLGRWHRLAFPSAPDLGTRRLERLRQTLASTPAVRDLCRNPLLLTLIALLNRGDELPRRRHKLLERAAELMLGQWDANRGIQNTTRFEYHHKRRYLAELAWHMLTDEKEVPGGAGNIIDSDALHTFTTRYCARAFALDPASASETARALVRHLRERNYVLGLLGGQSFGFLHKAFFEYFAAEEVHHRFRSQQWTIHDIEHLFAEQRRQPEWLEQLVLLCGLLQEDRPEHVITALQATLGGDDFEFLELSSSFWLLPLLIRATAEIRALHTDPAQAFAQEINHLVWAALRLAFARHHVVGPWHELRTAFQFAESHWPEIPEALDAALAAPVPATVRLSGFVAFSAALTADARYRECTERIRRGDTTSTLALVARQYKLWPDEFTARLREQLRTDHYPFDETLGLLIALVEVDDAPPSSELWSLARELLPDDIRLSEEAIRLSEVFAQVPVVDTRADVLRLLSFALLRARPATSTDPHILGLFEHRPPRHDEPRTRTLLAALDATPGAREDPYLTNTANRLRSLELLDAFLNAWQSQPDDAVKLAARRIYEWDEGIAHLFAWGRAHGATQEVLEFATSLKPLQAPHRSAEELLDTLQSLVALRTPAQREPNWLVLTELRVNPLVHLPPSMQLAFIEHVQRLYPDHALDIGLTLLEISRHEEKWPELHSRAEALLDQARHQDLVLAIYFTRNFATFWPIASADGMLDRLLHTTRQRDLERLLGIGLRARYYDLPLHIWRPVLRHVFDHATSTALRLRAALELGDRDLLEQLHQAAPDDLGPRAALDVLDSLDRLRKIGRPRRAIVRLDGTRVGTLVELPSSAGTRFTYDRDYLATPNPLPLAPNLPLRPEPYDAPGLHPVFAGLLPQGWLLDIDLRKYDLRPGDDFGLLLATGRDTIGAVEILPE